MNYANEFFHCFYGRKKSVMMTAIVSDKMAADFTGNVIKVVEDILGYPLRKEHASLTVHELLDTNRERADAALLIFGSDWPSRIEALKGLKIIIEGCCPDCGGEIEKVFVQTLAQTPDSEREGFEYTHCLNHCKCGWNNYELNKF
jgi:formate dehydrogenase maturation protein FdhE